MRERRSIEKILKCDGFSAYIWLTPVLIGFIANLLKILSLGSLSGLSTMLIYLVMVYIVVSRRKQSFSISVREIIYYFIIVFALLLTILFFPQNSEPLKAALSTSYFTIIYYFAGKSTRIKDVEDLYTISMIGVFMSFVNITLLGELDKDMSYSYTVLPYVIISIDALFKYKRKILYIASSCIGIVLLILLSTRGPLLLIAIFICYKYISNKRKIGKYVVAVLMTVAFISFIRSDLYMKTVIYIYNMLSERGIHNVMLYNYIMGRTASVDNRITYMSTVLNAVADNPLMPHGLCGDRVILNGHYSHNIICEMLYTFGGILGAGAVLHCIGRLFNLLKKTDKKNFIICLLFAFLGKLLFSGSFVSDSKLYFMIGILITIIRSKNLSQKTDGEE